MLYYQSGGIMKDKIELYCELSHKLAMDHLIERFCFELEANRVLFNENDISLEVLINVEIVRFLVIKNIGMRIKKVKYC